MVVSFQDCFYKLSCLVKKGSRKFLLVIILIVSLECFCPKVNH